MGGEDGGSFVRAMMCWRVMSVWVLLSETWESAAGLTSLVCGGRRRTWTMMGSLAVRKASTAWSWVALERSFPLTWIKKKKKKRGTNQWLWLRSLFGVLMEKREEGFFIHLVLWSVRLKRLLIIPNGCDHYLWWLRPHTELCAHTISAVISVREMTHYCLSLFYRVTVGPSRIRP